MEPHNEHQQQGNHGTTSGSVFSAARDPVTGEFNLKGAADCPPYSKSGTVPKNGDSPFPAVADQHLQADLRLFARLESATILLQSFVNAGRTIMQDQAQAHCVSSGMDDSAPAKCGSAIETSAPPRIAKGSGTISGNCPEIEPDPRRRKPVYKPRVTATPMMVLSFRAAKLLLDASKCTNTLAHDLLNRGVDLEHAVYKRRISDYVLEFLRECGVDITDLPANDAATLKRAFERIDEVIDEAVQWVNGLPGYLESGRRQRAIARQLSPQGP